MSKYEIKLPGGGVAFAPAGDAGRHQRIVDARHQFVVAYCKLKGWPTDLEQLSWDQIKKVRAQPDWKAAAGSEPTEVVITEGLGPEDMVNDIDPHGRDQGW